MVSVGMGLSGGIQGERRQAGDSTVAVYREQGDLADHVAELVAEVVERLVRGGLQLRELGVARDRDVGLVRSRRRCGCSERV